MAAEKEAMQTACRSWALGTALGAFNKWVEYTEVWLASLQPVDPVTWLRLLVLCNTACCWLRVSLQGAADIQKPEQLLKDMAKPCILAATRVPWLVNMNEKLS